MYKRKIPRSKYGYVNCNRKEVVTSEEGGCRGRALKAKGRPLSSKAALGY
jgi:hypothetical protein